MKNLPHLNPLTLPKLTHTYVNLIRGFNWLLAFHLLHHLYVLALPPLIPFIHQTFVPSYFLLGILRSVFMGIGFLVILTGRLSDRFGEEKIITLEFLIAPLFLFLAAIAPSYGFLLLSFAGLGLARCMYHPAGLSFITKAVPSSLREKLLGIHEAVGSLGGGLAFVSFGFLGGFLGWRLTLVTIAIPVLLLVGLYFFRRRMNTGFSKIQSKKNNNQSERPVPSRDGAFDGDDNCDINTIGNIFGIKEKFLPSFYLHMSAKIVFGLGRVGIITFLPAFLNQIYGMSVGTASGLIGAGYMVGVLGNLAGGKLANIIGLLRAYILLLVLAALAMFAVGYFKLPVYLVVLCIVFYFLFNAVKNPSDKALLAKHSYSEGRGKGYGSYFTFTLLGEVIAGPLFGLLIEWIGMRATFSTAPILFLIAALLVFRIKNIHRTMVR